jgi:hypothetical protein
MGEACSTHGKNEKCIKILVRKCEGPPGRNRRRWKDNIGMDLGDIG